MPEPLILPSGLVYLPLGEEVLPLLKRGVVPLYAPTDSGLPWFAAAAPSLVKGPARASDADYLAHLQQEYERLPDTLRGLLTLEVFIRQADRKRADIEAALLAQRQLQVQEAVGDPGDWLMQRFFPDAGSLLAWQQGGGLNRVWLGIDVSQWPQASLQAVSYQGRQPAAYPQRLLCDAPDMAALQEWRLVQAVAETERLIQVGGRQQGLLRLPPKALRCLLLGAELRPAFRTALQAFWRQDFRYQRTPLAGMVISPDEYGWHFQTVFTNTEKA